MQRSSQQQPGRTSHARGRRFETRRAHDTGTLLQRGFLADGRWSITAPSSPVEALWKRRAILGAVAVALVLAAPADARPAVSPAKIAAVARIPWRASHCYGREVITILPPAAMDAAYGGDVDGWAVISDPACVVWVRGGMDGDRTCAVLTHELGHLAGMDHSANPRSVMYPDAPTPERCWRFAP